MAGILAAGFAPAAVNSKVLMPVRQIATPPPFIGDVHWAGVDLARSADIAGYCVVVGTGVYAELYKAAMVRGEATLVNGEVWSYGVKVLPLSHPSPHSG